MALVLPAINKYKLDARPERGRDAESGKLSHCDVKSILFDELSEGVAKGILSGVTI